MKGDSLFIAKIMVWLWMKWFFNRAVVRDNGDKCHKGGEMRILLLKGKINHKSQWLIEFCCSVFAQIFHFFDRDWILFALFSHGFTAFVFQLSIYTVWNLGVNKKGVIPSIEVSRLRKRLVFNLFSFFWVWTS